MSESVITELLGYYFPRKRPSKIITTLVPSLKPKRAPSKASPAGQNGSLIVSRQ